ncbi:MAG: SDR family oxidoreductase [Gammaproteobacteria bacterium]|nr:SDR family oxidoreductase [Gammaproteobacteria bacterium]
MQAFPACINRRVTFNIDASPTPETDIVSSPTRTALVCGASRGIGAATAAALASDGYRVVLLARNEQALQGNVRALPAPDKQQHDYIAVDINDSSALQKAVASKAGDDGIQVLINNSGGPAPGTASDAEPEAYTAAFRQHLLANQVLMQTVLPAMKSAGFGRIINIISTSVKEPIPGLGVSNTIRAAVAAWAKTLSHELGPHGVTVNNVLPGYTATERLDEIFRHQAKRADKQLQDIIAMRKKEVPLQRFADPSEIAAVIAFLASPAASYINGINLPVDGGRSRGQ